MAVFFPALLSTLVGVHATPACHAYQGDFSTSNLGPPVPGAGPADCCAACQAAAGSGCVGWTFTAPGVAACYLHAALGAGVDSASPYVCGTCGDDAAWDAPLALLDGPTQSGVPIGGMGVGWFDVAPDGGVTRVAINGWHEDNILQGVNGTFAAVWRNSTGTAQLMQRRPSIASPLLAARSHALAAVRSASVAYSALVQLVV